LASLIFGLRRLRDAGGTLTLQSPNPKAMKTLTITGLTQVFTIT
jgi:anti-anti-sigma regulatory factor